MYRQHGGGFCTRVSCEEDSGIYVCNDNAHPIWVDYAVMASYAQYVLDYDDAGDQTACTVSIRRASELPRSIQPVFGIMINPPPSLPSPCCAYRTFLKQN